MITLEDLIETCPSGSGIDFDYENIKINSKGKISFENAFHLMDENGFYDGIIPFRITIDKDLKLKVQFLDLNPHGWYLVRYKHYGIRDYLEEIYYNWLEQYKQEIIDIFKK